MEMRHKNNMLLLDYWNSIRDQGFAPLHSEIEPRQIKPVLPYVFILERMSFWTYRFRLSGTGLCTAYSRELRWQNLLSLWKQESHTNMARLLNNVTSNAMAGMVQYTAWTGKGHKVPFEMLLLPMTQDNGNIKRIIGAAHPLESLIPLGSNALTHQSVDHLECFIPAPRIPVPDFTVQVAHGARAQIPATPNWYFSTQMERRTRIRSERTHIRLVTAND